VTLENKEFTSEMQSDITKYEEVLRVFRAIGHHSSIGDLTSVLAAEASQLLTFDFIGVSLCDDAMNTVKWHVAIAGQGVESGSCDTATQETMTKWVYEKQKPLLIPRLDCETRLQSEILALAQNGITSVCAVPLNSTQCKLGALFVGSVVTNAYSTDEVRLLSLLATQVCFAMENILAYEQIAELKNRLEQENLYLEEEICETHGFNEIVGRSAALRSVLLQVETVAPTDATVLIYGETGTGKELIARAIHDRSTRNKNSFVKLNCAAIPSGLLESELFGHERGAFTGAISQRIGRFELANHGTMFLDEIGEIPLELQPKLLRVLQEREYERLGNSRTLRTNTRLVAATNRNLAALVREQRFRSDLFYRLNVFPIRIPALRERPEDIPSLVRHFLRHFAQRMKKEIQSISTEAMNALRRYHWPGNVRELENVIERAVIVSKGPELRVPMSDLDGREATDGHAATHRDAAEGLRIELNRTLKDAERAHILATLRATGWTISGPHGAAERLGINRSTLQFRMKKLGIKIVRDSG
jgi:formate hydrogenlyase transcriptional activator